MFQSISWQEFFTTLTIILGGYYAISVLLLFSSEITHFFKSKPQSVSESDKQHPESTTESPLMGGVRFERSSQQELPREETSTSEELQVASQEDEEPITSVDLMEESLQNDFASITIEVSSLAEIASQSTKEESAALFKTLLSNYPQLIETPFQQRVSQLICDSCREVQTHAFDLEEVNAWWSDSDINSQSTITII
jgi:hypothetical protein